MCHGSKGHYSRLAWSDPSPHPRLPGEIFEGRTIFLFQKDIRELQLAKAAVAAGIQLLLQEYGITAADIDEVYLAGALGNYVNPISAMRIGLIPNIDPEKMVSLGNATATVATMVLLSKHKWQRTIAIADQVEHLEVSLHPGFYYAFITAMDFPDVNLW